MCSALEVCVCVLLCKPLELCIKDTELQIDSVVLNLCHSTQSLHEHLVFKDDNAKVYTPSDQEHVYRSSLYIGFFFFATLWWLSARQGFIRSLTE